MLRQLADVISTLFVAKACCTVIGWAFESALEASSNPQPILQMGKPTCSGINCASYTDMIKPAIHTMGTVTFVWLLVVLLERKLKSMAHDREELELGEDAQHLARTDTLESLIKGLPLLPVWAFKDLIQMRMGVGSWRPEYKALSVLLSVTAVTGLLTPTKKLKDERPLLASYFAVLVGMPGLGVAYAINVCVKIQVVSYGHTWGDIPFMAVYCPIAMLATIFVNHMLEKAAMKHESAKADAENQRTLSQVADKSRVQQPTNQDLAWFFWANLIKFLKTALIFVNAWAWYALIDAFREDLISTEWSCDGKFFANIGWGLLVLTIGIPINVFLLMHHDKERLILLECMTLVELVSAINVSWVFTTVVEQGSTCYMGTHLFPVLVAAWVFVIITIIIIALAMFAGNLVVERLKIAASREDEDGTSRALCGESVSEEDESHISSDGDE